MFSERLRSNAVILFLSESSASALMMVTGFIIARMLGLADFGRYTSALAFASILAVLVDSGMGMIAAREIARGTLPDHAGLDQIFSWRLRVMIVACLVAPLAGWALLPSSSVRWMALWLTPGILLLGLTDFFCWLFKGARRAAWCAVLQISSRALLLVLSLAALTGPHPVGWLLAAYSLAGGSMAFAGFWMARRSLHAFRWVPLSRDFLHRTLPDIYQMGAILILSVVFTRVDLMIVAKLQGDAQAGLYGAAGRAIDALRLIPMVVYSIYLPLFSSLHQEPEQLRALFVSAQERMLLLSLAIALAGGAFAWPLFTYLLGPQYAPAAACFRPLVWSCVLMFSNILMFSLLYALNDSRTPLIAVLGALGLEILLDILLVPRFGIVAASYARLAAETLNCSILAWGVARTGIFRAPKVALS